MKPFQKRVDVFFALSTADDLSIAFRRDAIHSERDLGIFGIGFHVEGLNLRRESMDEKRLIKFFGKRCLFGRPEVAAPFDRYALRFESFYRFGIADAREGGFYVLKLRRAPL